MTLCTYLQVEHPRVDDLFDIDLAVGAFNLLSLVGDPPSKLMNPYNLGSMVELPDQT